MFTRDSAAQMHFYVFRMYLLAAYVVLPPRRKLAALLQIWKAVFEGTLRGGRKGKEEGTGKGRKGQKDGRQTLAK